MGDTPKHSLPARAKRWHGKHRFTLLWYLRNSPHTFLSLWPSRRLDARAEGAGFKPAPPSPLPPDGDPFQPFWRVGRERRAEGRGYNPARPSQLQPDDDPCEALWRIRGHDGRENAASQSLLND